MIGGSGRDSLYGGGGDDWLDGGTDNDLLYGGAGRDILIGGRGSDVLWGGPAADVFMFRDRATFDRSIDFIGDFARGVDKLDFRGLGLSFIGSAQFSQHPQIRAISTPSGVELRIDINGDRSVDLTIKLHGLTMIGSTDFLL